MTRDACETAEKERYFGSRYEVAWRIGAAGRTNGARIAPAAVLKEVFACQGRRKRREELQVHA